MRRIPGPHQDRPLANAGAPAEHSETCGVVFGTLAADDNAKARPVYADFLEAKRSVVSADPEIHRMFQALVAKIAESGEDLAREEATAATRAALLEAQDVAPSGAVWASIGAIPGLRARLPRPQETLTTPFGQALEQRQSVRQFQPIDIGDLSTLLYHSVRVRAFWTAEDGYPASHRAAPSAGARHPIDVIVVPTEAQGSPLVADLPSPAYLFDPYSCELIALPEDLSQEFLSAPRQAEKLLGTLPPVVLVFVARLRRTFSRYYGGLSLVYRDAGALLGVISLTAAALNLACCPLAKALHDFSGDIPTDWADLGGIALGRLCR